MLRGLRDKYIFRYFCGFLALYLLNCSVDTADPFNRSNRENLQINDQESIIEFVVEQLLGFEDAILEYDDVDSTKKESAKKNITLDKTRLTDLIIFCSPSSVRKIVWEQNQGIPLKPHQEITSPPPDIILFV